MKKAVVVFTMMVALVAIIASGASAAKLLPEGAKISAVSNGDGTATVTIVGIQPVNVEYYAYEGTKDLGPVSTFVVRLREGRRFNFTWGAGDFALITPEMAGTYVDFFGPGIGADCTDPKGCCFLITVK